MHIQGHLCDGGQCVTQKKELPSINCRPTTDPVYINIASLLSSEVLSCTKSWTQLFMKDQFWTVHKEEMTLSFEEIRPHSADLKTLHCFLLNIVYMQKTFSLSISTQNQEKSLRLQLLYNEHCCVISPFTIRGCSSIHIQHKGIMYEVPRDWDRVGSIPLTSDQWNNGISIVWLWWNAVV